MDFKFTPDQEKFRNEVRSFIQTEVPPERRLVYGQDSDEQHQFALSIAKKLVDREWLTIGWPQEYGGGGRSQIEQAILAEEAGYGRMPRAGGTGLGLVGPSLMLFGTDEQKKEFLPKIARMEIEFCQGFSEPSGGTDLANLQLRATKDGDEFVLNGEKTFNSAGLRASYIWMLARSDPDSPRHHGISMFIVELNTPGITLSPLPYINGTIACTITFDNVRIPASALLGQERRGFYQAMTALDLERSGVERYAGVKRTFDEFITFCQTTKYNGEILWDNSTIRGKLASIRMGMEVWKLLCWKIAWLQSSGEIPNAETSIAFLYGTELRLRFAELGMQVLGPFGTLRHGSEWAPLIGNIQGLSRESLHLHGAGTSEVHRNIIAQRGLSMPRGA